MNAQVKTILLTILTLSVFTIAIVELSGVSSRALFNKYGVGSPPPHATELEERNARDKEVKTMPKTSVSFTEAHYDFGKVKEGGKIKHAFKFKNTGQHPLMISDVITSCGCTVPSFSKEPVLPGKEGEVVAEFNTKGRVGKNHKSLIVVSNSDPERVSLSFEAEVTE
ncbi:DUF1573 domain-containing protein [Taibaiella koreensis]|uniref:DUF1573 domain-containing protein n=1 Tax=Taibaiella koreensis TaxID=1268548 RepID=UPI0013C2F512|nr:DUF1573 domain-containing protein [Taibaiella koreensis]